MLTHIFFGFELTGAFFPAGVVMKIIAAPQERHGVDSISSPL
jgi:hypothetical protein